VQDVGGHEAYKLSRGMFYRDLDGIIMVYDVTNKKSLVNLKAWETEIKEKHRKCLFFTFLALSHL
jgi:Rab-like protein 3